MVAHSGEIIRGREKKKKTENPQDFNRNKTSKIRSSSLFSLSLSPFLSATAGEKWAYRVVKRSRG